MSTRAWSYGAAWAVEIHTGMSQGTVRGLRKTAEGGQAPMCHKEARPLQEQWCVETNR
jgi:hypothetical protein